MWKHIPDFDNYLINEKGDIKSLYHNIILKPINHNNGYKCIVLYKNSKSFRFYIHRLVAISFLTKPEGNFEINHKDGDKTNNNVSNLEWVTKSQNHIHRVYSLHKSNNMIPKKVKCVETGIVYESVSEATRKNNLKNPICISNAANGIRHKAAGYHWCFI